MRDIKTIGIIGLGAMGRPMARHLMAAGFTVCGSDRQDEARSKGAALGVQILAAPADVARQADCVMIVVGFDSDVERVFFAPDGLMESARDGLIVGVGSTISPSYARELAERTKGSGLILLDMALTRGEAAAEAGKMLVLGGGDRQAFDRCRPALQTFASDIFHLGPFSAGQVAKMTNNMILWACIAANDEAIRLAEGLGMDTAALIEALSHSSAQNWAMSTQIQTNPMPWAEKDMVIAMIEADNLRMPLPLAGHVRELIKAFKLRHGYPTPKIPK